MFFSTADPVNLKSAVDSGGFAPTASVVLMKVKSDPDPTCERLITGIASPVILKSPLADSTDDVTSVALDNPNSEPDPT